MRMVYGLRGAKWVPSFLRTIASTHWFAYQTMAGSLAVVAIPHPCLSRSVIGALVPRQLLVDKLIQMVPSAC